MNNVFQISFPGIGIDKFSLNRVAFTIGKIEVRWYGILITLGIALAFYYAYFRGKRNEGVVFDDIIDIGLCTVSLGVIGARLYYVLTTLDQYSYNSFLDVIAIWNGGLAIYGGVIGGCLGILIACKWKKIRWQKAFDMIAPGVMIAQAIGRWGNFFNGEAYGSEIGEKTCFYFFNSEHLLNSGEGTLFHTLRMGLYPTSWSTPVYYHPTFFYESVWNILGFILINIFYKHKKFDGQVALMYFSWYGFGRMFIEGLRTDSLLIPGTTLRISQCLGLACFVVGVTLLIVLAIRGRTHGFAPVFQKAEAVKAAASCEEEVTEQSSVIESVDPEEPSESTQKTEEETNEDGKID